MAESVPSDAGRRLGRDLRRIRQDRQVSLEELYEESKVPLNVLEEFEDTGLFEHAMFNPVYLRSLVRTYASVIDIAVEDVVAALDDALAGRYQNQLAVKYLDADPLRQMEEDGDTSSEPLSALEPPPSRTPDRSEPLPSPSPSPVVDRRSPTRQWMVLVGILVVVVGVVWLVIARVGGPALQEGTSQGDGPATTSSIVEDSAARAPEEGAPPAPRPTLGDTMLVTVVAAYDRVDPVRVRVDEDLRRPYWIPQDSTRTFTVRQQIVIENQLDDVRLLLDGLEYPTDQRDDRGRIVITRERAAAFLDTVTVRR